MEKKMGYSRKENRDGISSFIEEIASEISRG